MRLIFIVIFLLIGIDDISKKIPNEITVENLVSIVSQIKGRSPQPKVFRQSVFPINPTFENFPVNYNKLDQVMALNKQLRKVNSKLTCTFINLFTEFGDDKNLLNSTYSTDGLYLNEAGYQDWVEILKNGITCST